MDNEDLIIGVKFGNNCCVGVWKNNKVNIILNNMGNRTTPSIISFTENGVLIGKEAEYQKIKNSKNTIYGINKLIGRNFDDPKIQKLIKNVPYKIEKDSDSDKPIIIVENKEETNNYSPEELNSIILKKLKEYAEKFLNQNVSNIIITVPSYYNEEQRESIKKSVELADLNLIELMDEPISACIAYELEKDEKEKNVLVFSMGSSKLTVSILNVKILSMKVINSFYDGNIGGDYFDDELVKYCVKVIENENKINLSNLDKNEKNKIYLKIKKIVERGKILLSTTKEITLEFDFLIKNKNIRINLKRNQLEKICEKLIEKSINLIEITLKKSKLNKSQIDEIILAGGSSSIPKIQEMIKKYFNGKEIKIKNRLNEVYAYGTVIESKYKQGKGIAEAVQLLDDLKESHDFLEQLKLSEITTQIQTFTGQIITRQELEIIQLNNPKKEEQRKEEIDNIISQLNNNELTNEEYTENVLNFGSNIKEAIIYNVYHNPEKFISKEEIENSEEDSSLFIQGALFSYLNNNDILCAIEKETENENVSHSTLQLITSGEAFRKVIKVSFTYGDFKDALILSDENERQNFIKMKKTEYSKAFNIAEQDIIITDIHKGSYTIKFLGQDASKDQISQIKKDPSVKDVSLCCLLVASIISPSIFDSRGDRSSDWGINEKRGPPQHLMVYDPPIGWKGFGLRVWDQYDNGDNTWLGYSNVEGEWYIAYHGTSLRFANDIIEEGLKAGTNQLHNADNNINPLNKDDIPICGEGVYVTPLIKIADEYSGGYSGWSWSQNLFDYKGVKYQLVFMCRVNPYKIRICSGEKNYWIVSGDKIREKSYKAKYDNEIRPYRILLKEFKEDNEKEE